MANASSRAPLAGGFLLAMSLMAGVIIGSIRGEPSMGFVIGLAVGIALVLAIWLRERARR